MGLWAANANLDLPLCMENPTVTILKYPKFLQNQEVLNLEKLAYDLLMIT
jgi:hypothetical protein